MTLPWIDVVYGTRPEAVKCAPLVVELRRRDGIRTTVTVTGQHREMADEVNASFGIRPDADLDVLRHGATLAQTSSAIFSALSRRWSGTAPDAVVVQGDTASAALAAVAAYYAGARVIHLEAGLRSGNLLSPFPEEGNRRLIAPLASLHLAPTESAAANLRTEGVATENIVVTGNTGIDALRQQAVCSQHFDDPVVEDIVNGWHRVVVVTVHRRESWGGPLSHVVEAVAETLAHRPGVIAVLPAHPNPQVRAEVRAAVGDNDRVVVCEPLPHAQFGRLLSRAYCVVTDSGGVQEEAPALGVPVLVVRETTERDEGVAAGAARLIGTQREIVAAELAALLDDEDARERMAGARSLYGDGYAAPRAADAIERLLGVTASATLMGRGDSSELTSTSVSA
ncbi:UDP-N-acetylglucosamine 2-epimerase (non-hydrolyzing) [Microbacterium sp. 1154]|uniref:non-hydrolyzing UDP-N-acetylglucosamine 2-epimerase n=1 Tax=Microbacterium sp. 1154 TaxID=2817733 RepID=UPI000E23428D|nr:UDP-N-acetylglucosamine 2-epimerase (non-hydrolyzing) [Microbacterium sp. 1154]MDR6689905.1 UDP-N-acetylglucosamine 2-epimerase (non-hydrolyzing) [Microbacterium sp. 1154]